MMNSDETQPLKTFFDEDLDRTLAILAAVRPEQPKPAQAAFEAFERRLARHFEWEEHWLFPAAAAKGADLAGTAETMRAEHREIRKVLEEARGAVRGGDEEAAPKKLRRLDAALRAHAVDEGRELLEPLDRMMSAEESAALLDRLPRF